VCDEAENCTGGAAACPADAKKPQAFVCRAAAGVCDRAEKCGNVADTCGADARLNGTRCRPAMGPCDAPETCDGTGPACPAAVLRAVDCVCRASERLCDPAETCDGASAACPAGAVNNAAAGCVSKPGVRTLGKVHLAPHANVRALYYDSGPRLAYFGVLRWTASALVDAKPASQLHGIVGACLVHVAEVRQRRDEIAADLDRRRRQRAQHGHDQLLGLL
jgi:hypothetical protein